MPVHFEEMLAARQEMRLSVCSHVRQRILNRSALARQAIVLVHVHLAHLAQNVFNSNKTYALEFAAKDVALHDQVNVLPRSQHRMLVGHYQLHCSLLRHMQTER